MSTGRWSGPAFLTSMDGVSTENVGQERGNGNRLMVMERSSSDNLGKGGCRLGEYPGQSSLLISLIRYLRDLLILSGSTP